MDQELTIMAAVMDRQAGIHTRTPRARHDDEVERGKVSGARQRIIDALNACGGEVADDQGAATGVLRELVGAEGNVNAFTNLVKNMEKDGQVERDVVGKRTYAIRVVGAWREPVTSLEGTEPPRGMGLPEPVVGAGGDVDLGRLAWELLVAASQAIAAGGGGADEAELDELKVNLAAAHEHAAEIEKKWRNERDKVEVVGDELAITRRERDVLKAQVRQLEANVQTAIRQARKAGPDTLRIVERFMQEKPKGGKG